MAKFARNAKICPEMPKNGPEITYKAQSCPKWPYICPSLPRIDPNVQICPEWTIFVQNAVWWWNWKSTMMIKVKGNLVSSSARPICSSSSHSHLKWPLLLTLQYMSRNTNTKTLIHKYNYYVKWLLLLTLYYSTIQQHIKYFSFQGSLVRFNPEHQAA